jgi:hypothetical protein
MPWKRPLRSPPYAIHLQILSINGNNKASQGVLVQGNSSRALHVAQRTEADVVERVVRDFMCAKVRPAVLEAPECDGIHLVALPDRQRCLKCETECYSMHIECTAAYPHALLRDPFCGR